MLTDKDPNIVVVPNIFKSLSVALTDDEIKTRSVRSAECWQTAIRVKDAKAASAKSHNEQLKEITKEISQLSDAIRTGQELQLVECYNQFLFRENIVKTFRTDSGALVGSRAMTHEERDEYGQIEAQLG